MHGVLRGVSEVNKCSTAWVWRQSVQDIPPSDVSRLIFHCHIILTMVKAACKGDALLTNAMKQFSLVSHHNLLKLTYTHPPGH